MDRDIRLSHQGLRVLRAFLDAFSEDQDAELAGTDVMKAAGLSSGTLYPILLRLEKAGVLHSRWEKARPEVLGRPRRRYYSMTRFGRAARAQGAQQSCRRRWSGSHREA